MARCSCYSSRGAFAAPITTTTMTAPSRRDSSSTARHCCARARTLQQRQPAHPRNVRARPTPRAPASAAHPKRGTACRGGSVACASPSRSRSCSFRVAMRAAAGDARGSWTSARHVAWTSARRSASTLADVKPIKIVSPSTLLLYIVYNLPKRFSFFSRARARHK